MAVPISAEAGMACPVSFSRSSMASAVGSGTSSGRLARAIGSEAIRIVVAASRLPLIPAYPSEPSAS